MLCCKSSSKIAKRSSICFTLAGLRRRPRGRFVVDRKCTGCFRFIVCLLVHRNGLRRIAHLHAQRSACSRDAEILVAQSADQVEGLLRGLLLREAKRVGLDLRLDGSAHLRRGAEVPIRRHRAVDALVWALEVVVLDEKLEAPQAIGEVGEHRPRQKLLPQRLPEPLDLTERLGMLRPALAVRDAVATQELLKFGRATPRRVLPTLVGQHLARLAVLGDAALERVDHKARLLVVGHRPRHEVPRVVVHEADEVHALMPA